MHGYFWIRRSKNYDMPQITCALFDQSKPPTTGAILAHNGIERPTVQVKLSEYDEIGQE